MDTEASRAELMANRAKVRDRIAKAMAEIHELEMSISCNYCAADPGVRCHTNTDKPTTTHKLRTYAAIRMRKAKRDA